MANTNNRQVMLTAAVRGLRGVERALDGLGWHRIYNAPAKRQAIYSEGKSEGQLAKYQKNQGRTNNCGAYSVAAALRLIADEAPKAKTVSTGAGARINYDSVVETANRHAMARPGVIGGLIEGIAAESLRMWPGGPTTPRQQARLARFIAARQGMHINAEVMRGTPEDLLHFLAEPLTHVLVTIGWSANPPQILYPDGKFQRFGKPEAFEIAGRKFSAPFNAHVMLLAAYDPSHTAGDDGQGVPWGFINSWVDAGEGLYWMTEDDFRSAWRFVIPLVGRQQMVVIQQASTARV